MKGLFQGTADLRDLTQYKNAKQTTIAKTFQWPLNRLRYISYPNLFAVKKKAYKTVLGTDYDHIDRYFVGKIFSMKLSEYILLSMHSSCLFGDQKAFSEFCSCMCTIKIFVGEAGAGDTFDIPPANHFCLYPVPLKVVIKEIH